jgi:nitroreductase
MPPYHIGLQHTFPPFPFPFYNGVLFIKTSLPIENTFYNTTTLPPKKTSRGEMMEFIDVIKARTSVREYSEKQVEEEKIIYVLECARLAPSSANKQCWRFIVIQNKVTIEQIAKTTIINRWLKTTPVLIVACADPTDSGTVNSIEYYTVDVSIALEHIILAATNLGLGTCWVAEFNEEKLKELLEVPKRIRIVALTPLGYLVDKKGITEQITTTLLKSNKRKTLDEIVHHEQW